MKQTYLLCISLLLGAGTVSAQSKAPVFTADSVKSGNSKDIIVSFFQLGLNNLIGKNREFNVTTSPYAVMLKRNPDLSLDSYYKKYRPLRKLNLSAGVRVDTSFNFNGFSSGLKYALIDNTDITVSDYFAKKAKADKVNIERETLNGLLQDYYDKTYNPLPLDTNDAKYKKAMAFLDLTDSFQTDKPFSKLDNDFRRVVMTLVSDNFLNNLKLVLETKADSSFKDMDLARFEAIKNEMKKNLSGPSG